MTPTRRRPAQGGADNRADETKVSLPYTGDSGRDGGTGSADFRRYAAGAAVRGTWIPWAEFADRAWRDLSHRRKPHNSPKCDKCQLYAWDRRELDAGGLVSSAARAELPAEEITALDAAWRHVIHETETYDREGRRRVGDSLGAWRAGREPALAELGELGLTGTVVRVDDDVPLGEHEADLAGLVRLHPAGSDLQPPSLPAWAWGRDTLARYALRMLGEHGLTVCGEIPTDLRGFCGQHTEDPPRPHWTDHAHTWSEYGAPVLTVEPYSYAEDPQRLVREVQAYLSEEDLPLEVAGPYPGVWYEGTTLVILRYDGDRYPLPAECGRYDGLRVVNA